MKKFVSESLNEFRDSLNENKKIVKQSKEEKYKEAIASLKKQLADAKKPSRMKVSKLQHDAKVKEIEDKIKVWEDKLKKINESFEDIKKNHSAKYLADRIISETNLEGEDSLEDTIKIMQWFIDNWKDLYGREFRYDPDDEENPYEYEWPEEVNDALDILNVIDFETAEALDIIFKGEMDGHY